MPKTKDTTIGKIKQRAYWQIEIFPAEFNENAINFRDIQSIVSQAAVQYRGWDYPHIVRENIADRQLCYPVDNTYYEAWIDWSIHKEIWRAYKSGKFTHLFAVHEQWFDEHEAVFSGSPYPDLEHKYLDVVNVVFKVTEILEFVRGYINSFAEIDNFVFRLKIMNAEGNELTVLESSRLPLSMTYTNHSTNITGYDGGVSKDQLSDKDARDALGTEIVQTIFHHFDGWQWVNDVIASERQKLIERRLL